MKLGIRDSARKLAQALKRSGWRKARAPLRARRFLSRSGVLAGGRWGALRLQWRRVAQLPMASMPPAAAALPYSAGPTPHWLAHIHLHVATPAMAARLKTSSSREPGYASRAARKVVAGEATHNLAARQAFAPQPLARFAAPRIGGLSTAPSQRGRNLAPTMSPSVRPASPTAIVSASAVATPLRAAAMHTAFATRRPESQAVRPAGIAPLAHNAPLNWRRGAVPLKTATQQSHAADVGGQAGPASAAALWQPQSPALVWRRQPATQPDGGGNALADGAEGGGRAATARKTAPPQAAPVAPTASAIAAQLRAAQLDPVLTDRLATEVIRRVERSLRIARERRGY
ncbi:hypothetical protein [Burkholderia sp. LMU1-1-1.1]|uniref:hypothetical protein n=1 Tax=Burkholderia sp. LMU1-1-1.1 TaxID=3135266 RepID=UPI00343FB611